MGNGWHEWPLVIFTVLGQCVVGALIVSGIGWFAAKNDADRQRIVRGMFFLWLLMGVGFIASVMHLGSPLRAFNSLNRIGASGLSNEIAAGSIFFAVGGLWWLVAVIGKMPQALGKLWLLFSMALGVIFVWMMTCVYQIDTVPTWHNGYTTLAFFLTVLLSGPILAAAILRAARVTFNTTPFAIISVLALIACAGVIVLQGLSLASIHSSVQQASALVPDYASLQVWRVVLLCAGLGCWLCPLIRRREPHVAGLILGLILILGGEMIGRVLFYGLHMTVGAEAAPLVAVLTSDGWETQWPLPEASLAPLVTAFQTQCEETHAQAWQRLFVGPWALPSPPWGSVWLDRESVLFGDSTLALRQWMREKGIQFEMKQNEPEDHFGSLLLMAAWLAENGRQTECEELLAWHLFPWSTRFLDVFIEKAEHPFYRALGELARLTLAQWQSQLLIPVAVKPLFR